MELQLSRLQLLFEDNGEGIRSWKDTIWEKEEFEIEVNLQGVAAFSFWAITSGSKSPRIQGKGLGRGSLLKGRETLQE